MIPDLLDRPTPKRPTTLRFDGRVLLLLDDAELVRKQLYEGQDIELTDELRARLRDQISTDEITPAYICYFHDETLGESDRRCLALARQRLRQLHQRVDASSQEHLTLIKSRLEYAEGLEPSRAREIYSSVVELYSGKPWARELVDGRLRRRDDRGDDALPRDRRHPRR